MELYCTNCGYKFAPKGAETPKACPYCNKPETVERVKNAQDYLNEVMSEVKESENRQS